MVWKQIQDFDVDDTPPVKHPGITSLDGNEPPHPTESPVRYTSDIANVAFNDDDGTIVRHRTEEDHKADVWLASKSNMLARRAHCPICGRERPQMDWFVCDACVDAVHKLAFGFETIVLPLCRKCEKRADHPQVVGDGVELCVECMQKMAEPYNKNYENARECVARIQPGPLLLRPGAITLAVDDPCGDDVAEDV